MIDDDQLRLNLARWVFLEGTLPSSGYGWVAYQPVQDERSLKGGAGPSSWVAGRYTSSTRLDHALDGPRTAAVAGVVLHGEWRGTRRCPRPRVGLRQPGLWHPYQERAK